MAELAFNLDFYGVDAVSHPASHENRIGNPQGSFSVLAQPGERSNGKGDQRPLVFSLLSARPIQP